MFAETKTVLTRIAIRKLNDRIGRALPRRAGSLIVPCMPTRHRREKTFEDHGQQKTCRGDLGICRVSTVFRSSTP